MAYREAPYKRFLAVKAVDAARFLVVLYDPLIRSQKSQELDDALQNFSTRPASRTEARTGSN
jgi:hypothetical protein